MIGYHNGAKQRHASVQELDLLRYLRMDLLRYLV
jgi:hypothetical protein